MHALWTLRGEAVLRLRGLQGVEAFVHYLDSPVGAYDERALIALGWRGPQVTAMPVSSAASCAVGHALWGFPKTVADVEWRRHDRRITFRQEHEYSRFVLFGPALPLRVTLWTRQEKDGRIVRVPFRMCGRARLARSGKQCALFLEEFVMQVYAPR